MEELNKDTPKKKPAKKAVKKAVKKKPTFIDGVQQPLRNKHKVIVRDIGQTIGKPRKYTRKELAEKIEEYFALQQAHGVIGLAVHLDVSRETVNTWRTEKDGNGPYSDLIRKAHDRISSEWEQRLADGKPVGSIFWLKCQDQWKDAQEVNVKHEGSIKLNIGIKDLDI
jgi:hypothetical protein